VLYDHFNPAGDPAHDHQRQPFDLLLALAVNALKVSLPQPRLLRPDSTDVKNAASDDPILGATRTIPIEIPPAMSAYSMPVTPV
jgi:hypothetical protein